MKYIFYMALTTVVLVQGCAYNEMTYFRKHGATLQDERLAWGLCGGNFLPDGQVRPNVDKKILKCMSNGGYQSINDYYVEQQISFIDSSNANVSYIPDEILSACGFRRVGGLCKAEPYIRQSQLSRVLSCMASRGYGATLPRYKSAFRIIEDDRGLSQNFCLTLSPRNRKGGVSLGGSRLE